MVKHTEQFLKKHKILVKEREIQRKLKKEEQRRKKEASYERYLERRKKTYQAIKNDSERYKKYLEYQREYSKKRTAQRRKEIELRMNEILKDKRYRIYKGYYVTDNGEIYNKNGVKIHGYKVKNHYHQSSINGKTVLTHRFIWEAFFGEIPEDMEIDHINTIRDDNRLDNLRLVHHIQNCNNPTTLINYSRGNTTGHCIPIIQIMEDGTVKRWISAAEAGRNGYSQPCIWSCLNGRCKTHKGSKWLYEMKNKHPNT